MKKSVLLFFVLIILSVQAKNYPKPEVYNGKYCSGEGDTDFLRLIDESFAFFHSNPVVPNLTMITIRNGTHLPKVQVGEPGGFKTATDFRML